MTRLRTTRFITLILAVTLSGCVTASCPMDLPSQQIHIGPQILTVEVADDDTERACGLSHRHSLAPDHGMLFVFGQPVRQAFWMKNTHLPLSIAFLDGQGHILELQDMTPDEGQRLYMPASDYHYALETNHGWFAAHGITVGDRVLLDGFPHRN